MKRCAASTPRPVPLFMDPKARGESIPLEGKGSIAEMSLTVKR